MTAEVRRRHRAVNDLDAEVLQCTCDLLGHHELKLQVRYDPRDHVERSIAQFAVLRFAKWVSGGARCRIEALARIKWKLWHGNTIEARETIEDLEADVSCLVTGYPNEGKFFTATREFAVYIASNAASLVNYGERYRSGERISSAFVEATVNAVVSKRFAKKQQMQWTRRGAHLLLQTRTRTLDGTLRSTFQHWFPNMSNDNAPFAPNATAA